MKPNVLVIGSINVDMSFQLDKWPILGETIKAKSHVVSFGGKGANQAIAASRAGGSVTFISNVGNDSYGKEALNNLEKNNININSIKIDKNSSTGKALICNVGGENWIIIDGGANNNFSVKDLDNNRAQFQRADIILVQNEIPFHIQKRAVELANEFRTPLIYNPAPSIELPANFIEKINYITPNEIEAEHLFSDDKSKEKYKNKVIITKGKEGIEFFEHGLAKWQPGLKVKVQDSTGAGDTFNGYLAVNLAKGLSLQQSIYQANQASAISVQRIGAQKGIPYIEELLEFNMEGEKS